MAKRKEIEKKIVAEREKKYMENCKAWYAISMNWIAKWKLFVNHTNSQLPGPIENVNLYQEGQNGKEVLSLNKGLIRNKDYKMANESVWNFFYSIYGGGPVVVRKEKDIYSD